MNFEYNLHYQSKLYILKKKSTQCLLNLKSQDGISNHTNVNDCIGAVLKYYLKAIVKRHCYTDRLICSELCGLWNGFGLVCATPEFV